MPRSPAVPRTLPDHVVASLVADVRRLGAVARRDWPKLPPPVRALLEDALRAASLEVTRGGARVPMRAQLLALVAKGPVEDGSLAAGLRGVAPAERKSLVESLLAQGALRRVIRPAGVAFALASERVLEVDDAARIAAELDRAMRWIRRAARSPKTARAGLLAVDLTSVIQRLAEATGTGASPACPAAPGTTPLLDRLVRTAFELAVEHGGLAPLPQLVRAMGAPTALVHAALLEGHARGWFELQPESSMGRLGADDLALCLPGPQGTRLSWVRPLRSAASQEVSS